jgi:hypothetical protein
VRVNAIEPGAVVIVHCMNPKEKLWGVLLRLDPVGVTVRGMDVGSVEDWMRQESTDGDRSLAPSTFLVPSHRLVRIDLDESSGAVPGFADRFRAMCGRPVEEALCGPPASPATDLEVQ